MSKEKRNSILIIILTTICFIAFIFFAVFLAYGHNFFIDEFNYVIANHRNTFFNAFFKVVTHLGAFYVLILLALIVLICFKNKRVGIVAVISLIISSLVALLIKYIVRRPRPQLMLVEVSGFSFPSAHAVMTFALFAVLTFYLLKYLKNRPLKIVLTIINVLIVLLIGFSRIYLGVHFVSDVLAGYLLSFVTSSLTIAISERVISKLKNKKHKNST